MLTELSAEARWPTEPLSRGFADILVTVGFGDSVLDSRSKVAAPLAILKG
jgi:hypothetical protein